MVKNNSSKKAFDSVFNDEYLIVVNKLVKILIQPSPKKEKNTLTSLLEAQLGHKVYPCHRLDRETTGLIIYAKTVQVQAAVAEQFRRGQVKKKYRALVRGNLVKGSGFLVDQIIDKEGRRFGESTKLAKTAYRVLEEFPNFSLLELKPFTGRTNQLRIQLAKFGHPILGERKYAFGRDFEVRFRRLALQAFYLQFLHPISREKVELTIDLANDIKDFLRKRR